MSNVSTRAAQLPPSELMPTSLPKKTYSCSSHHRTSSLPICAYRGRGAHRSNVERSPPSRFSCCSQATPTICHRTPGSSASVLSDTIASLVFGLDWTPDSSCHTFRVLARKMQGGFALRFSTIARPISHHLPARSRSKVIQLTPLPSSTPSRFPQGVLLSLGPPAIL